MPRRRRKFPENCSGAHSFAPGRRCQTPVTGPLHGAGRHAGSRRVNDPPERNSAIYDVGFLIDDWPGGTAGALLTSEIINPTP